VPVLKARVVPSCIDGTKQLALSVVLHQGMPSLVHGLNYVSVYVQMSACRQVSVVFCNSLDGRRPASITCSGPSQAFGQLPSSVGKTLVELADHLIHVFCNSLDGRRPANLQTALVTLVC
jgi:hypothetical protein